MLRNKIRNIAGAVKSYFVAPFNVSVFHLRRHRLQLYKINGVGETVVDGFAEC